MATGWWEQSEGQSAGWVSKFLKESSTQGEELSREALDNCIEKITRQIDDSKARIYETVNSHYADLVHALSVSEGMVGEIEGLEGDLEAIENEARNGKLAQVIESKAEQRALAKRLATTKATTAILQKLCKIDTSMQGFDDQVECGEFDRAADTIHTVSELVVQLEPESENGCDPKIFQAIRSDLRRKKSKLKSQLEEMWRSAIVWGGSASGNKNEPRLQIASAVEAPHGRSEVPFSVLTKALIRVGSFNSKVNKLGDDVVNDLLKPITLDPLATLTIKKSGKAAVLTVTKSTQSTNKGKGKSARDRAKSIAAQELAAIQGAFGNLQKAIEFVTAGPFSADPSIIAQLGAKVWMPLSSMVQEILSKRVSTTKPQQYQTVLQLSSQFEDALKEAGVIPADANDLSSFLENMNAHQTQRRRQEILETARDLLGAQNFNTVAVKQSTEQGGLFPESGDGEVGEALNESLYCLPQCHVSVSTKSLVDFAYSTLSEAPDDDEAEAIMAFYGVRDMLDLFRAIVPLKHADMFATVPQVCAVFHNDCFYIAHHLLTLGHQFRSKLPEEIRPAATFVDLVPAFQELGESTFFKMQRLQQIQIVKELAETRGLGGTDNDEKFESIQRTLQRVQHQLTQLASFWKDVLPVEVYCRSMGTLSNAVVDAVINDVKALEDMTSVETQQLRSLFKPLLMNIPTLFEKFHVDAIELASDHVESWKKFVELHNILDAGLKDITQIFTSGKSSFSGQELRGFIKAIFTNSELRASCLAKLS